MHQQKDIQTIAKGKAMKTLSRGPKPQEITVVIACVLVLICTVGAIGQRTREHSHQLTCYAQMMTLLDGWTQFAADHEGELVVSKPGDKPSNSGNLPWVLNPDPPLEDKIESIVQGALFPYVGDVCTYHCPADTRLSDPNLRALRSDDPNQPAFRSYSISGPMNGEVGPSPSKARWSDEILDPASALVFIEEPDPRGRNLGSWLLALETENWIDPVATWHERACNLGFADGHVERHRWQNQSTIDWGTAAQFADPGFSFHMIPEDGFEDYDYMRSIYEIEFNRRPGYKEPGESRPRNSVGSLDELKS
jgi:prepilin-type processing-associated H-X9-DG protein